MEGSHYSRGTLKRRLFAGGLKHRACELCGQGENWRGRAMALILDHVNGVATDNRLENLRIVCPNCAATLDTHRGRNLRLVRPCAVCGSSFHSYEPTQRHCSRRCGGVSEASRRAQVQARTVERPPYEELVTEIAATSYVAMGRKYGCPTTRSGSGCGSTSGSAGSREVWRGGRRERSVSRSGGSRVGIH